MESNSEGGSPARAALRPFTLGVVAALGALALLASGIVIGQVIVGRPAGSPSPSTSSTPTTASATGSQPTSTPAASPISTSSPAAALTVQLTTHELAETDGYTSSTFTTARVADGPESVVRQINTTLESEVDRVLRDTRTTRKRPPPDGVGTKGWTEQRLVTVPCQPGLLCLRMIWDHLPPGTMIHVAQFKGLVFDGTTGRRLQLEDVLTAAEQVRLMPAVAEAYRTETGTSSISDTPPDLTVITGTQAWIPTAEGLWVYVPEYALGPTPFETVIPWNDLSPSATP